MRGADMLVVSKKPSWNRTPSRENARTTSWSLRPLHRPKRPRRTGLPHLLSPPQAHVRYGSEVNKGSSSEELRLRVSNPQLPRLGARAPARRVIDRRGCYRCVHHGVGANRTFQLASSTRASAVGETRAENRCAWSEMNGELVTLTLR